MTPERTLQAIWFGWWMSWLAAAFWSDRAANRPGAHQQIVYRLFAAAGAVLLFGMYRHDPTTEGVLWRPPGAIAWVLVVIAVVGLLFTWWARLHLGRLWSSAVGRKADHRVVDTGPYGIVRHPIYTGITLAAAATAALRGTVAADGRLYLSNEDGEMLVVAAGREYKLIAKNSLGELLMATPALSDGVMYVRSASTLFAIGRR